MGLLWIYSGICSMNFKAYEEKDRQRTRLSAEFLSLWDTCFVLLSDHGFCLRMIGGNWLVKGVGNTMIYVYE